MPKLARGKRPRAAVEAALASAGVDDGVNPKTAAAMIANSLALPTDVPPVRVSDDFASDRTAVAAPKSTIRVSWDCGSGTPVIADDNLRQLPRSNWGAFFFPDMARQSVVYTVLPSATPFTYQCLSDLGNVVPTIQAAGGQTQTELDWIDAVPTSTTLAPHGAVLPAGEHEGHHYLWIDANNKDPDNTNAIVAIGLQDGNGDGAPYPSTTYIIVRGYRWNGTEGVLVYEENIKTGSSNALEVVIVPVPISGYWYFTIEVQDPAFGVGSAGNNAGTTTIDEDPIDVTDTRYFTMTIQTQLQGIWAHHTASNLYPMSAPMIDKVRTPSVCCFYQNQAATLYKQGAIVGVQVDGEADWFDGLAATETTFFDAVMELEDSKQFLLESGLYGYRKPSSEDDFRWKTNIVKRSLGNLFFSTVDSAAPAELRAGAAPSSTVLGITFDIGDHADYLCIVGDCNQDSAGNGMLTVCGGINYKTQSTWIEKAAANIPQSVLALATRSLKPVPQWFDNPTHWGRILGAIGAALSVGGIGAMAIPGVGTAVGMGLSVLGSGLNAASRFLEDDDKEKQQSIANPTAKMIAQKVIDSHQNDEAKAIVNATGELQGLRGSTRYRM